VLIGHRTTARSSPRRPTLADAGLLTPLLDATPYSRETVADAHHAVETGQSSGKVVVRVG
jgi:hypothetical protein